MDTLADIAVMEDSNIIILSETHLKPEVGDCEIKVDRFNVFRSDREDKSHGGMLIYTKEDLSVKKVMEWKNTQCEVVAVVVRELRTLVISIYRPPNKEVWNNLWR